MRTILVLMQIHSLICFLLGINTCSTIFNLRICIPVLAVPLQSDERYIVISGRTQCRKTTSFLANSSERNLVGQLFFHQIRANAMSWGNCSFTKFRRTQCRGATVLALNCTVP
ncbi:uncharacterized protein [Atheta coriaria]|uniref:uncharacterized protein isoform X14 n=1 Tax=Dalotia coriaria TaxID=877792 RepID=UPI0031F3B4A2